MSGNDTRPGYGDGRYGGMHWFGWLIIALLIVMVVAFVGSLFTGRYYGYGPMMGYGGYPYFGWFFPFGFIFPLIFVLIIVRMAFWGFGGWGGRRRWRYGYAQGYGDAREILRQRYASGDITKDQFDQMMSDLDQH